MLYPGRCLEPTEIEMLARVSRSVCKQNGLPFTSPEAARTASHLLKLFMNGLTSEEELLDAAQNCAKRLPCVVASRRATVPPGAAADCLPDSRLAVA
ncbi:hypothetical protein [Mesorhizobium sp. B2-3-4]|uniref:hypothetical protein n=1 Tax=Mesorhizobium sp. B2-3-4 TaxID=2589959 RepID=UPI0015E39F3D|nr:hypothetical protein [Mesorhizobium sp. B2-3-4]